MILAFKRGHSVCPPLLEGHSRVPHRPSLGTPKAPRAGPSPPPWAPSWVEF